MRKLSLVFVCVLLIVTFVPKINAATAKATSDEMKFYINVGAITNTAVDTFWWQTGVMLDLPLGNNLFLTPEVMLSGWKFDFNEVSLYPGATINLKFGEKSNEFFVGSGLLIYFVLAPSSVDTNFALKIHGGYISNNIKLTLFYTHLLKDIGWFYSDYFGANIGFAL
jgi:hypothetical protein